MNKSLNLSGLGLLTIAIIFCSCEKEFNYGTVTDIEGNTYKTIQIGNQTWMAENLKTTKYNDGLDIPLITGTLEWSNLSTPGYCWYNNDSELYGKTYGALYNWFTVNTGKLCPTGWHIPSDTEWHELSLFLDSNSSLANSEESSIVGGILKEIGTNHWNDPNAGATDNVGFRALPGNTRKYNGSFFVIGRSAHWWSSTESTSIHSEVRSVYTDYSILYRAGYHNTYGMSVRCIKDN